MNGKHFILVAFILLASCASPRYIGQVTFNDLLNARVECTKGLPTNAYGAVSCNAFEACLATKGWAKVFQGGFEVPPQYALRCN